MTKPLNIGGYESGFGKTARKDDWLEEPFMTVLGLSLFMIYATWAAFQGEHYYASPYLSPFYSPPIYIDPSAAGSAPLEHAWLGSWPSWCPNFLPASPAFFILMFPGLFRLTCYYYRKAYYRSFMGTPPGCAVNAVPQGKYRGETFLFLFQNLHRYALYFAIIFIIILAYDAILAFSREGILGVGVGSLVLTINVILLSCYTFGCHSFRHLIGGKLDGFSSCAIGKAKEGCYESWKQVSCLNKRHMLFAWCSLFSVGFTDLYVRMVSMDIFTDYNTWDYVLNLNVF